MMSPQLIQQLSDEAAYKAAREGKTPLVIWSAEKDLPSIPFLGSHVPSGWRALMWDELPLMPRNTYESKGGLPAYFMVDASGMGSDWEPALTFEQLVAYVQSVYAATKQTLGLAIVEQGQFQIVVQWYEKENA
jgi:hypothetical protein